MSAPPDTVVVASREEAEAIRSAVRDPDLAALGPGRVVAGPEHAQALADLLADPAVSDPVYDLPRPITAENVAAWIAACELERQAGEGLLTVNFDDEGRIAGYSHVSVWPERASAELAGASRADLQGRGRGGSGAGATFGWIFEHLGARLMCLTAALDNVRSQRLIDRAGFVRMGERDCVRPDGTIRRSAYWELDRETWRRLHGAAV
ncbi:MAG: GNAT family N-acetyltransferase [Caulobacteraceae bacterium]|nr:GNAT family N-acetyltransferase [Caulobacteraceae bacterium]